VSPRLPALKPRDVFRALERAGFVKDCQTGSHIILYKEGHPVPVTLPWYSKDLKRGTLRQIIKDAGLDVETFLELL
jgi:predicted RNA binding protein YcfA (HicA-like mRNA interferase family)